MGRGISTLYVSGSAERALLYNRKSCALEAQALPNTLHGKDRRMRSLKTVCVRGNLVRETRDNLFGSQPVLVQFRPP